MTDDENTPREHIVTDDERREHRLERIEDHVDSLLSSRKNTNRALWIVIPALIGALGTVLVFAAEKIAASYERVGETRATIAGLRDRLDDLKDRYKDQAAEIGQLRATLLRLGVIDPRKPTSDVPAVPDGHAFNQGGSSPHRPKLQRPQPSCGKIWHSGLLLQMSLHRSGWCTSSISLARSSDSSSVVASLGGGSTGSSTGEAQPATAIAMTRIILSIPQM